MIITETEAKVIREVLIGVSLGYGELTEEEQEILNKINTELGEEDDLEIEEEEDDIIDFEDVE